MTSQKGMGEDFSVGSAASRRTGAETSVAGVSLGLCGSFEGVFTVFYLAVATGDSGSG
jgi:hypothetical protein